MKLTQKITIIMALIIASQSVSFAEETKSKTETKTGIVNETVKKPVQEQSTKIKMFESPSANANEMFSDPISKYNATLNEANIQDIIFPKHATFYLRKDSDYDQDSRTRMFFEALERYNQSNVSVAYKNFNSLLVSNNQSDLYYILMAYQMADIGFFSLSDIAMNKVGDKGVWQQHIDAIRKYYYPKYKLSYDDELFLANIYTSINYNNLTRESVMDVTRHDRILRRSDYANYLVANAFFIEKDYAKALNFINKAISINSENINYQKYKARILCEQDKFEDALKLVNNLESKKLPLSDSKNEIDKLKYYLLAKSEKNDTKSKYYFSYYFYLNKDYTRALKDLSPISYKAKDPKTTTLIGEIYLTNSEPTKAQENFERALTYNKHYAAAYKGLGDIYMQRKDYINAQKAYSKAVKYNSKDSDSWVALSILAFLRNDDKTAKQFCEKSISVNQNNYKGYYVLSKLKPEKSLTNLSKASVLNPFFANIWLDLADFAILNKDYITAKDYIDAVKFLDENNYRYYYYKGILAKINKDGETANMNFQKASSLYSKKTGKSVEIPTANIKEF